MADVTSESKNRAGLGSKKYIGVPCSKGHGSVRYIKGGCCVECVAINRKKWTSENEVHHRKLIRNWHFANRPRLDRNRKLRQPFRFSLERVRTEAAKAGLPWQDIMPLSRADEDILLDMRSEGCAYCGSIDRLTLDHKVPVRRGGQHELSNLQWLCVHHNSSKHAKTHEEFVRWCAEMGMSLPRLETSASPMAILLGIALGTNQVSAEFGA